jgi:hypothetical protein
MEPINRWRIAFFALLAMSMVGMILTISVTGLGIPRGWDISMFRWSLLVAAFGGIIGTCELVARYRDDPLRSLTSSAAMLYIIVNIIAATFAYLLIRDFGWQFGAVGPQISWVQAFVAGFGAMVFFRSSLFQAKVGDTSVAIGPGIVFQILLQVADRSCDRRRGEARAALVKKLMRGVSFSKARMALPSLCFGMMQNVGADEQAQFNLMADALTTKNMPDDFKTFNLGLMLLNVVGEKALDSAIQTAGERIQNPVELGLEAFVGLQKLQFDRAFPLLVDICFIMSCFGTEEQQAAAKKAVMDEISQLKTRNLDNGARMTMLGLSLKQRVGDEVLRAALACVIDPLATAPVATPVSAPAMPQQPAAPAAVFDAVPQAAQPAAEEDNVVPFKEVIEPANPDDKPPPASSEEKNG